MKVTIEIEVDHSFGPHGACHELEGILSEINFPHYLASAWVSIDVGEGIKFHPNTGTMLTVSVDD